MVDMESLNVSWLLFSWLSIWVSTWFYNSGIACTYTYACIFLCVQFTLFFFSSRRIAAAQGFYVRCQTGDLSRRKVFLPGFHSFILITVFNGFEDVFNTAPVQ